MSFDRETKAKWSATDRQDGQSRNTLRSRFGPSAGSWFSGQRGNL